MRCNQVLNSDGVGRQASAGQAMEEVFFEASPVEPDSELGEGAFQMLRLSFVVGAQQESLQVRQSDSDSGK